MRWLPGEAGEQEGRCELELGLGLGLELELELELGQGWCLASSQHCGAYRSRGAGEVPGQQPALRSPELQGEQGWCLVFLLQIYLWLQELDFLYERSYL